jgi:L-amino acid N-acyltransferase YncA
MRIQLDALRPADWPQVAAIYGQGIATGDATFETETPDWSQWDRSHLRRCRLVAREAEDTPGLVSTPILGWAALSPVSSRRVYAGVTEVSLYVAAAARGRGVAGCLLAELIRQSEAAGVWTLQAMIFRENAASLKLHEKHGFRRVGYRERIGRLHGVWRDVALLERRSRVAG